MPAKPIVGTAAPATDYIYRRQLTLGDQLPAIGIAIGAGIAAFYVARILIQRTPLVPARDIPMLGPSSPDGRSSSRRAGTSKRGGLAASPTITRRTVRRVDAG